VGLQVFQLLDQTHKLKVLLVKGVLDVSG
jgi:hypothetical protein